MAHDNRSTNYAITEKVDKAKRLYPPLTWTCEICKKERPDEAISVETVDISESMGLPSGSVKKNIKYCNDNLNCWHGAIQKGKDATETKSDS